MRRSLSAADVTRIIRAEIIERELAAREYERRGQGASVLRAAVPDALPDGDPPG